MMLLTHLATVKYKSLIHRQSPLGIKFSGLTWHDLGYEGFQMECQSAGKNVMAQEQDLRAKLLKHKGTHNVKTDIKS
ncbi:hypothetical protein Tco_1129678 [Tanacetum coccineum]